MKIAPLKVSDPWFGRIVNDQQVHSDALGAVPIESTVEMELVELLHGGPEENYRPYLHLRGELTEVRPAVELPYGVSELALRRGAGLSIDAFYDFNQEQLSDLVSKGYFTNAFQVPDEMSGIPWTLPGKADFLVVAPALADEPPLVFMNVHEQNSLALDEANSGYELAAYFPDYTAHAQLEHTVEASVTEPERSGTGLDIFSDVAFEEHRPVIESGQDTEAVRTIVPDGVFSRLVSEIQTQGRAEEEPLGEEVEEDAVIPGSAWDLYLSKVSPGVDHVLAGDHLVEDESEIDVHAEAIEEHVDFDVTEAAEVVEAPVTEDGYLDLAAAEPEAELTPLSVQAGEVTTDEHRKAAERRAAQLRAELEGNDPATTDGEAQPVL